MTDSRTKTGCAEFRQQMRLSRRGFLKVGALGAAGLSLADVLRSEAHAATGRPKKNVIILWMRGGPAHQDMWDLKPDSPPEVRGDIHISKTFTRDDAERVVRTALKERNEQ